MVGSIGRAVGLAPWALFALAAPVVAQTRLTAEQVATYNSLFIAATGVIESDMKLADRAPVVPDVQKLTVAINLLDQALAIEPDRWPAMCGIEHVGREARNPRHTVPFPALSADYQK